MKKTRLLEDCKELDEITNKLPNNEQVAKDILNSIGNTKTKIVIDSSIKSSYYVDILDTIYISNSQANNFGRICLIAHECRHSIQSKLLQKLNFITANLELILFIAIIILRLFNIKGILLTCSYALVLFLNIAIRLYLERDAVYNSTSISHNYLKDKIGNEELLKIDNEYKKLTKKLMPLFILKLIYAKLIRLTIILLVYYY